MRRPLLCLTCVIPFLRLAAAISITDSHPSQNFLHQCRCNVQFIALPSYSTLTADGTGDMIASSCTCRTSNERRLASPAMRHVPMPDITGPSVPPPAFGGSNGPLPSSLMSRTVGSGHHSPSPHRRTADDEEAIEASEQCASVDSASSLF